MRKSSCVALLAALWACAAGAVSTEGDPIPYGTFGAQHLLTDSARNAGDGIGYQLGLGVPLESASDALELRLFSAGYDRAIGGADVQGGLFVDWVHAFEPLGGPVEVLRGITPFVIAGAGVVKEDVQRDKHMHFGASLGAGVRVPLGYRDWALRLDARAQLQRNDESVAGEDLLVDYQVNLGLQLPLGWFFDRPAPAVPAPVERPVAVVEPVEPVTPTAPAAGPSEPDGDGDGVADVRDRCRDTLASLQVDADGCVVAQTTALRGVTFETDSMQLTPEGRQTLDGVAATLRDEEDLKVEIAGHTDAVGSEAYNTLLSQQRADAVRAYLVEQGIDEERLTAVGYGELEPVATNDTDEGRGSNRRVEFRITTE